MKTSIEIELQPFTVPNFVIPLRKPRPRQDGFESAPGLPLSDLSAETLTLMCDEFRSAVFKKAGLSDE